MPIWPQNDQTRAEQFVYEFYWMVFDMNSLVCGAVRSPACDTRNILNIKYVQDVPHRRDAATKWVNGKKIHSMKIEFNFVVVFCCRESAAILVSTKCAACGRGSSNWRSVVFIFVWQPWAIGHARAFIAFRRRAFII